MITFNSHDGTNLQLTTKQVSAISTFQRKVKSLSTLPNPQLTASQGDVRQASESINEHARQLQELNKTPPPALNESSQYGTHFVDPNEPSTGELKQHIETLDLSESYPHSDLGVGTERMWMTARSADDSNYHMTMIDRDDAVYWYDVINYEVLLRSPADDLSGYDDLRYAEDYQQWEEAGIEVSEEHFNRWKEFHNSGRLKKIKEEDSVWLPRSYVKEEASYKNVKKLVDSGRVKIAKCDMTNIPRLRALLSNKRISVFDPSNAPSYISRNHGREALEGWKDLPFSQKAVIVETHLAAFKLNADPKLQWRYSITNADQLTRDNDEIGDTLGKSKYFIGDFTQSQEGTGVRLNGSIGGAVTIEEADEQSTNDENGIVTFDDIDDDLDALLALDVTGDLDDLDLPTFDNNG